MLKVGLTGGIASGKSVISHLFKQLGVRVIDTDTISHQLMQPGQAAYARAVEHFGAVIVNQDQSIDRALLREHVFNNPAQRRWLEQMIHPLIRQAAIAEMQSASAEDYVLLVVPLLFESGFDELVDHVIAIDCPAEIQIRRLQQRDGISAELAQQMIAAQLSNQQRKQRADSIIDNSIDGDCLPQVQALHQQLKQLANN